MKSYPGEYELINPSVSILAQPSVAIVDDNANDNGTQEVSRKYLSYLYTEKSAASGSRVRLPAKLMKHMIKEYGDTFDLNIRLYTIKDYGGWDNAYKMYFDDGAMFDEIYDF